MSSLEQRIAELNENTKALAAAVEKNNGLLEATLTTREQALAAMEKVATGATTRKPRASKTEETTTETASTPTATTETADAATTRTETASTPTTTDTASTANTGEITDDKIRAEFSAYLGSFTDDTAKKAASAALVGPICKKFGVGKLVELSQTDRPAALFYLYRAKAGQTVDFDYAYDFAGDPAQSVTSDDDIG